MFILGSDKGKGTDPITWFLSMLVNHFINRSRRGRYIDFSIALSLLGAHVNQLIICTVCVPGRCDAMSNVAQATRCKNVACCVVAGGSQAADDTSKRMESSDQPGYSLHLLSYSYAMQTPGR